MESVGLLIVPAELLNNPPHARNTNTCTYSIIICTLYYYYIDIHIDVYFSHIVIKFNRDIIFNNLP